MGHPYDACMGALRDELHHLVDQLPEAELQPTLDFVRDRTGDLASGEETFPFLPHSGPIQTCLNAPR